MKSYKISVLVLGVLFVAGNAYAADAAMGARAALQKEVKAYNQEANKFSSARAGKAKEMKAQADKLQAEFKAASDKAAQEALKPKINALNKQRHAMALEIAEHAVEMAQKSLEFDQKRLKFAQEAFERLKSNGPAKA